MSNAGNVPNFTAASTILPYSCVKSNTSNPFRAEAATAEADVVIGVTDGSTRAFDSLNQAIAGDVINLQNGEFVQMRAGGSIAIGDGLRPTTGGAVITATSRTSFVAAEAAAVNEIFWAKRVGAIGALGGGGTPGGSTTQVQFNNAGAFAGDAGLTYNSTTDALTVAGDSFINSVRVGRGTSSGVSNTVVSQNSLTAATTGTHDTAVGNESLRDLTTGGDNTGIGSRAGQNITTGGQNTCIGNRAGQAFTTGSENVFIGNLSGANAASSTGSNTCVGAGSGRDLVSAGTSNTLIGKEAGIGGTNLYQCVAVGLQALANADASLAQIQNVTAIGTQSLRFTQKGVHTAVGASTLYLNTTGESNTAIGFQALTNNTTGSYNTALGNQALVANQTGTRNVALGEYCLDGNRGDDNVAAGINAGYRQWEGTDNVMIGDSAAAGKIAGAFLAFSMSDNVVIGSGAYLEPAGTVASPTVTFTAASPGKVNLTNSFANNKIVSFAAGSTLPSIVGGGVLTANTSYFVRNVSGSNFEISLTSGGSSINLSNTGSGTHTLIYSTAAGDGNTVVGRSAGAVMTTGANNVLLGKASGDLLTTGSTNICIGYNTDLDSATTSNQINVGDKYFHNRWITTPLTLTALNALPNLTEGMRGFCTDATATTFASTITGGGANNVPCYYDGAWKIG